MQRASELQQRSGGDSLPEIHAAALAHSNPADGLSWLDIGCGRGQVLRMINDRWAPRRLQAVDVIDWLDEDLRTNVEMLVDSADRAIPQLGPADRVLLIETLEHLEAPWTTLRDIARMVRPGGRLVVTTPNVTNLRHRLDLLVRGRLTAFAPDNLPHLTPCLPHVIARLLSQEGLNVSAQAFVARDVIPLTGGRLWPSVIHRRSSRLTSTTLLLAADAPR